MGNTQQWISIKSEMPSKNKNVLCVKEDGRMLVTHRHRDARESGNNALFYHESSHYNGGLITHWMLLPDAPLATGQEVA